MLMTPACPQPVSTTSPRPATWAISAWSSRISGSGSQLPPRQAWWIGKPFSNPVTRSTSPVISTDRSYRNDGCRCSIMPKPASSSARRLVVGSSNGSPGMARRRRAQNSGWISTGRFARPSWPIRPESPVVWSKWPWLQTIASMSARSWPRRRRLSAHPSGVSPVSNSSRRTRPPLRTSTSAENPCWASGTSAALPPSIVGASSGGASRAMAASGSRFAGPSSGSRMSVTLSQTVSTDSSSTGSSASTSPFQSKLAGTASTGATSARLPV